MWPLRGVQVPLAELVCIYYPAKDVSVLCAFFLFLSFDFVNVPDGSSLFRPSVLRLPPYTDHNASHEGGEETVSWTSPLVNVASRLTSTLKSALCVLLLLSLLRLKKIIQMVTITHPSRALLF